MNRLATALAALALALPATSRAAPQPMTRDEIIGLAKLAVGYSYWWGHGRWRADGADHGSCSGSGCPNSCSHGGSHGADCSGLAGKVWQVPNPVDIDTDSHPYSTYNLYNQRTHWDEISRGALLKGDELVYNKNGAGHVTVYESGDGWGSHWVYECKGCAYGCVHNLRTSSSDYIAIRRHLVDDRPELDAQFVGQGADVGGDPEGKAQLSACAGQKVHFWFELKNTGKASWVDWGANGKSWGQDVRLGVPTDTNDPIVGVGRVSISGNANPDVHPATWNPPGGDCNDQPFCQRTVFNLEGTMPAAPGIVKTEWRLVDEMRAWFGPTMWLSFNVVDCAPPAGPDASTPAPGPDAATVVPPGRDASTAVEPAKDAGTSVVPPAGPDASAPVVVHADAGFAAWTADGGIPVSVVPPPGQASSQTAVVSGCSTAPGASPAWLAGLASLALALLRRRE